MESSTAAISTHMREAVKVSNDSPVLLDVSQRRDRGRRRYLRRRERRDRRHLGTPRQAGCGQRSRARCRVLASRPRTPAGRPRRWRGLSLVRLMNVSSRSEEPHLCSRSIRASRTVPFVRRRPAVRSPRSLPLRSADAAEHRRRDACRYRSRKRSFPSSVHGVDDPRSRDEVGGGVKSAVVRGAFLESQLAAGDELWNKVFISVRTPTSRAISGEASRAWFSLSPPRHRRRARRRQRARDARQPGCTRRPHRGHDEERRDRARRQHGAGRSAIRTATRSGARRDRRIPTAALAGARAAALDVAGMRLVPTLSGAARRLH